MNEDIVKVGIIPVSLIAFVLIARVVHLRPELITNMMSQSGNAQALSLDQRAIACDPSVGRVLPSMSRQEKNDFVADCEAKQK